MLSARDKLLAELRVTQEYEAYLHKKVDEQGLKAYPSSERDDLMYTHGLEKGLRKALALIEKEDLCQD